MIEPAGARDERTSAAGRASATELAAASAP